MAREQRAQIGIDETVAIQDQHGIGRERVPREANGARGSKRLGLDDRDYLQIGEIILGKEAAHRIGAIAETEDNATRAEPSHPSQQMIEIRPPRHGRENFRKIRYGRAKPRAEAAGQNQNISRMEAGGVFALGHYAAGTAVPGSSRIRRRSLCRAMRST